MATTKFSKIQWGDGLTVTPDSTDPTVIRVDAGGGGGGGTGPPGPTGPAGPTGATGATGPAGPGVPAGGTTGQALEKASGTDYDTHWVTISGGTVAHLDDIGDVTAPTPADEDVVYWDATASVWKSRQAVLKNVATTKGDLIAAPSANNFSRLAVGSNNQVLTADSAQTLGVKWATPATGTVATDAIWDTKGDLAAATGADAAAKLPVGSNGQVLTADSTQTTGIKWATPSSGSAGAITLLSTTTIAGAAAAFDVSSIPGTYNDLILILIARSSAAAGNDFTFLRFNNDSGNNYAYQQLAGNSNVANAVEGNTGSRASIGSITADSATAGYFSTSEIVLPGYASTTWNKTSLAQTFDVEALTTGIRTVQIVMGVWASTAAINRVSVTPFNGTTFKIGSQLRIYGRL